MDQPEDSGQRPLKDADGASLPIARWEWDIAADRVTWSDDLYRLYGLEPREFRASYQAFMERVHPADRERIGLILGQALRDCRPFDFQHSVVRPDGVVRAVQAHGNVERGPDGKAIRMWGTSQDITA